MPRGGPAMPLEHLAPYYRGARFAALALKRRNPDSAKLQADADRYVAMVDRYSEAAVATFRLHRARERGDSQ